MSEKPLDASDLMGLFRQLLEETQLAVFDAFGPVCVSGGDIGGIDNELVATIEPVDVWAPTLVGSVSTGCLRGKFAASAEVSLRGMSSLRVAVGVVASEAANGFIVPVAIRDNETDSNKLALLRAMVPIGVVDCDALQAVNFYDARNDPWQLRSVSGGGTDVRGSKPFIGLWHLCDELSLGLVTPEANMKIELRYYMQVSNVDDNRGLEVGLVIDFIEAESDRQVQRRLVSSSNVPIAMPYEWSPPLSSGYYLVQSESLRWDEQRETQPRTVTPVLYTPPPPGFYTIQDNKYIFNGADTGRLFTTTYFEKPHTSTRPAGAIAPTASAAYFAQRQDVISGVFVIKLPKAGPHLIQIAIRGDGDLARGFVMGRVLPRSYQSELDALI